MTKDHSLQATLNCPKILIIHGLCDFSFNDPVSFAHNEAQTLNKPKALNLSSMARRNFHSLSAFLVPTHRPQSSSFLGLPYGVLNMRPQKGTTLGPMGSFGPSSSSRAVCTELHSETRDFAPTDYLTACHPERLTGAPFPYDSE